MSRATLLRVIGVVITVVSVAVALIWNPTTCVTNVSACPTPMPGSAPCPPSITTCSAEYVPVRIAIALAGLIVGLTLVVLATRIKVAEATP